MLATRSVSRPVMRKALLGGDGHGRQLMLGRQQPFRRRLDGAVMLRARHW